MCLLFNTKHKVWHTHIVGEKGDGIMLLSINYQQHIMETLINKVNMCVI